LKSIIHFLCRTRSIPLSLRRKIATPFIKRNDVEFSINIDGQEYHGCRDNYIEWVVFVTGQFFEFSYINLIKSLGLQGNALDIGANVGNHTLAYSAIFENVTSIEPYPPVYQRLQKKTAMLSNVKAFNVAFGNQTGKVRFAPPHNSNLGTGKVNANGDMEVQIVKGDEFLNERLEPLSFIKIDVEGHESEVLTGLQNIIHKDHPTVLFEAPTVVHSDSSQAITNILALFPSEYRFYGLKGQTSFPIQRQLAKIHPLNGHNLTARFTNILALPEAIWKTKKMITKRFANKF